MSDQDIHEGLPIIPQPDVVFVGQSLSPEQRWGQERVAHRTALERMLTVNYQFLDEQTGLADKKLLDEYWEGVKLDFKSLTLDEFSPISRRQHSNLGDQPVYLRTRRENAFIDGYYVKVYMLVDNYFTRHNLKTFFKPLNETGAIDEDLNERVTEFDEDIGQQIDDLTELSGALGHQPDTMKQDLVSYLDSIVLPSDGIDISSLQGYNLEKETISKVLEILHIPKAEHISRVAEWQTQVLDGVVTTLLKRGCQLKQSATKQGETVAPDDFDIIVISDISGIFVFGGAISTRSMALLTVMPFRRWSDGSIEGLRGPTIKMVSWLTGLEPDSKYHDSELLYHGLEDGQSVRPIRSVPFDAIRADVDHRVFFGETENLFRPLQPMHLSSNINHLLGNLYFRDRDEFMRNMDALYGSYPLVSLRTLRLSPYTPIPFEAHNQPKGDVILNSMYGFLSPVTVLRFGPPKDLKVAWS